MKRKKGVRIQLHHKNIILKMFLLSGIVLFTAFFSLFLKIKFKTLNNVIEVFKADFKEIIIPLVIVLLLTIAILII
ncbi:hypothetical protein NSB31_29835, partial [Bacillus cereus]